jgi:hypothetical protein
MYSSYKHVELDKVTVNHPDGLLIMIDSEISYNFLGITPK